VRRVRGLQANRTISYIEQQTTLRPNKPWFVYYAPGEQSTPGQISYALTDRARSLACPPGATHAPHHVPKEWIDLYKGQFDEVNRLNHQDAPFGLT
jgi:arylsulfatase